MRADLYKKITEFSHAELDNFGTASLVNRIINDVNQVENAVGIALRLLIRVPFLLIGAFIISLVINAKMSIVFLILIPIVCLILWIYTKKTSPHFVIMREKLDTVSKITRENLEGTRVIRAFNKQEDEKKRFNELLSAIGSISKKTLTNQLRELENDGLIQRKIYPEVPPKVEYSLTEKGKSLSDILNLLCEWGEKNLDRDIYEITNPQCK